MPFDQRSLIHQEVWFPGCDGQTDIQTHIRTSRLIERIGLRANSLKMVEAFTGSVEAADGVLVDTGSGTTGTDGVVTVIASIGTDSETILGEDINTDAVTGGEGEVPGSVDGEGGFMGGPARGAWRWAAWWQTARRRFLSLWAGPRGGAGGKGLDGKEGRE